MNFLESLGKMPPALMPNEKKDLRLTDVREGWWIQIRETAYFVETFNRYVVDRGLRSWNELKLRTLSRAGTTWLEIESGDRMDVFHSVKIPFEDLEISLEDLNLFGEYRRTSFSHKKHGCKSMEYIFSTCGEGFFFDGNFGGTKVAFKFWEFYSTYRKARIRIFQFCDDEENLVVMLGKKASRGNGTKIIAKKNQ